MEHPYGWLSLVPSLVAIVMAIATRRVVLSMFGGICIGALITRGGQLSLAVYDVLEVHLWSSLTQDYRLRVFAFTVLMGAMVGVIERGGGMAGLVNVVSRWAHNRRRGQIACWFLGLLVFFDDYANTVLLGNTLQPLCRRLRISKEKLAFLVDSTAAPVAGLAIISTWVAGEIEYIQSGLNNLDAAVVGDVSAFSLFVNSIPLRFYVLWALLFVFLVAWSQRDYGPMLKAERRTLSGDDDISRETAAALQPSPWWNAVIPIVATVLAVLTLLYRTGQAAAGSEATPWDIFGAADSYYSLMWGAAIGLVIAVSMTFTQGLLSWSETQAAMTQGAKLMLPALAVLWLAAALSALTGDDPVEGYTPSTATVIDASSDRDTAAQHDPFPQRAYRLYTGIYLANLIQGPAAETDTSADTPRASRRSSLATWMPTIIFLLAAFMSFSTGTSWGTMAIVMPIAIPLAYASIASEPGEWHVHPIMLATVGSVLAGSIFGDHCSPISDTTVLSSQACGCEHSAHVWTQLPYAMTVGAVTILCGTIPIGYDWDVRWLLLFGPVVLFVTLYILGSPTREESNKID